jgi:hypothetical protein
MEGGRVLHAELHLLDHQMRDRNGRLCGNVDDLELTESESGELYVRAIVSGPGSLLRRLGFVRFGRWFEQFRRETARMEGRDDDPGIIPMHLVHNIGPVIDLAVTAEDLASSQSERWVRDHIIGRIPGSRHDAGQ